MEIKVEASETNGTSSSRDGREKGPIKTWKDFLDELSDLRKERDERWIYRGEREARSSGIKSTFDRSYEVATEIIGNLSFSRREFEKVTLWEFKRRAHHYQIHLPRGRDLLEWLALMRHFGAPSRLVDFSYSPYVAAYFALRKATGTSQIWAVNQTELKNAAVVAFNNDRERGNSEVDFHEPDFFRQLIDPGKKLLVMPVSPLRLNERMSVQQGLFLCPGNINQDFHTNFQAIRFASRRIELSTEMKTEALRELALMNIGSATLYPGLEGFAMSLEDILYLNRKYSDLVLQKAISTDPDF